MTSNNKEMTNPESVLLSNAIRIAAEAHAGQVDKLGVPYILHPLSVMMKCSEYGTDVQSVAVLHDVLEDTAWTQAELAANGMSSEIVEQVYVLTKQETESYAEYLQRVSQHRVASVVKYFDLEHNTDPARNMDGRFDEKIRQKYAPAKERFQQLLMSNGWWVGKET